MSCTLPERTAAVRHLVYFQLADSAHSKELATDCHRLLGDFPGVVRYHLGRPVDVGRDTVHNDFDVFLSIDFATVDGYLTYVDHPRHKHLVKKWRPRLKNLRVHDVTGGAKSP